MCDWRPLLGWLIATVVALGGAISSAILGVALPPIAPICFGAAATWCLVAIAFALAASNALSAFCRCASASPACGSVCGTLSNMMTVFIGTMIVAGALAARLAFASFNQGYGIALSVAGLIALGLAIAMLAMLSSLATCQSSTAPTPPTPPPPGSGITPI